MFRESETQPTPLLAVVASSAALLACSWPLLAGTIILQNDSITDFGAAVIQVGFITDERAAAWLTAACDGDLVAVQVLWLSATGTAPPAIGHSISISEAGAFPAPGTELEHLSAPLMTDGVFNEFSLVPAIPLTTGQTIVVDFRFDEAPPVIGPSVVTDADGCQSGKNAIYARFPLEGWFDACLLGVSGDFAIRGVLDCGESSIFIDGFESGTTTAWSDTVP